MLPQLLVSKARKPKFELTMKIHDLNNVPLVSGTAFVRWHLPHSTSAEHSGRTDKSPIKEHKVSWEYTKVLPVRLTMDKSNMLMECTIQFEVIQEYNSGSGKGEKISLGVVNLNLAEYAGLQSEDGEGGITRRYLMQDSKINSTLKIGIAMNQVDGERNYETPPLKNAPVFGGIAGIMDFEQAEKDDLGHMPLMNRSRELGELQDMYRRSLAASWNSQIGELEPDECIEDIFAGGDGWGKNGKNIQERNPPPREHAVPGDQHSEEEWEEHVYHTKAPHQRSHSGGSSKSHSTIKAKHMGSGFVDHKSNGNVAKLGHQRGNASSSSISQASSSEESERGREGYKHAQEVDEFDIREDLVAWKLPDSPLV